MSKVINIEEQREKKKKAEAAAEREAITKSILEKAKKLDW